ncbi:MAG: hypothetical protein PsegKO_27210 [Pseudohongiellaceae bacterium]
MAKQAFYFSGGSYLQLLQGLHQAVNDTPSVQLLLGPEGSGKSALGEKLSQFLHRKQLRVLHLASGVESPELLRMALARQLELPAQANPAALIEEASHASGQPIVLIIDDAHLLTAATLLEIDRLAKVQIHGERVCSVVLSAEAVLLDRIKGKTELAELQAAASQPFVLQPMSVAELEIFLQAFAAEAGIHGLGFTDDAMHLLYKLCKGYPGSAGNLATELVGNLSGAPRNTPLTRDEIDHLIKNAAGEQVLPSIQLGADSARPGMIPVAAVIVIASLAFVYQQLGQQTGNQPSVEVLSVSPQTSPFFESPEPAPQSEAVVEAAQTEATAMPANEASASGTVEDAGQLEAVASAATATGSSAGAVELDDDRAKLLAAIAQAQQAARTAAQAATDSDLVLVTAAERGISADQFALPNFEDLIPTPESNRGADAVAVSAGAESSSDQPSDGMQTKAPATMPVAPQAMDVSAPTNVQGPAASNAEQEAVRSIGPAEVASSTPAEPVNADSEIALRGAVDAWLAEWQSQDLEGYFQRYHSQFQPRYQDSLGEWRQNRQRVIGNAEWIVLELTDFQVVEEVVDESAQGFEVHFWLGYESGSYQDRTLKKLVLVRENNAWRIIEEVNLDVQVQ